MAAEDGDAASRSPPPMHSTSEDDLQRALAMSLADSQPPSSHHELKFQDADLGEDDELALAIRMSMEAATGNTTVASSSAATGAPQPDASASPEEPPRLEREVSAEEVDMSSPSGLPDEPPESDGACFHVQFALPNGEKFLRRFAASSSVGDLYAVGRGMLGMEEASLLRTSFPSKALHDHSVSLKDLGMGRQVKLFVKE